MTADPPVVDGRDAATLAAEARERASYYTHEWDPDSDDAGTALLEVFSRVAGDVVERLDRTPGKHRVAFLDALGFERRPPRPARVPVAFAVSDGADGNVAVPGGTQAVAELESGERSFEVPPTAGFEATPSRLDRVYGAVPRTDQVFEHWGTLGAASGGVTLLDGADVQEHALYVGGGGLLDLGPGSTVRLSFGSNVAETRFRDCLVWEYYGEEEREGDPVEGWHPLDVRDRERVRGRAWSDLKPVEEFLDDVEPRLGRAGFDRVDDDLPAAVRYRLLASLAADVRATVAVDAPRDPDAPLPDGLLPPLTAAERAAVGFLDDRLRGLAVDLRRVDERAAGRRRSAPPERVELDLVVPGVTTEHAVAGVESRWLRCRLPPDDLATGAFDVEIADLRLAVGPGATDDGGEGLTPDAAFANGVPVALDGERAVLPFGDDPQRLDAFYVASTEAFTKAGTDVELRFSTEGTRAVGADTPAVSWEYWNGTGWARIERLRDETADLTTAGRVVFAAPHDLEPTTVAGHDGHWVRARLVAGSYGQASYAEIGAGTWARVGVDPPRFDDLRVHYDRESAPEYVVTHNNRTFDAGADWRVGRIQPFRPLADDSQALYFGFDGPLTDGPVQLLFSLAEDDVPTGFYSRLRWEYHADDGWTPLVVADGTEGFTRRGIVGLVFPTATAFARLFGDRRHWVRARVTGDAFALTAATAFARRDPATDAADDRPTPVRRVVETAPRTAGGRPTPPVVEGLYPNAGWAYDTRTVAGEVLGSSDGTSAQAFDVSAPPATHAEVRVDELTALSEGRRAELAAERPDETEAVTGPDGDVRRFWVGWERVDDFLGSGPDDRHYTLDGATGRVTFGNGVRGRIPPRGRENVAASYRTGGGGAGNVPAGSVAALKSSIPFVDGVTNPEPGEGGADGESTADAVRRAPGRLRDRGRAVTDADVERVAASASGEIARVRCLRPDPVDPTRGGDRLRPGRVTLVVVPGTTARTPTPSAALRGRVRDALRERAPATLLDPRRLTVRGPSYVAVSVTAAVTAAAGTASVSSLEEELTAALGAFLHPLSGGSDGQGWAFGVLPYPSDLYALLERVDGVDHVDELAVSFGGAGEPVVVREGDPLPDVAPDALVRSGTHDVRATGGV